MIRPLIKDNCNFITIPPLLNPNSGEITVNDNEKAEILNDYFASISDIQDDTTDFPDFDNRTENSIESIILEQQEIEDVISSLKLNKASGIDEISHQMLKGTKNAISKPLKVLFNKCLAKCIFPLLWKKSKIMPIFKKGDKHIPSNYRRLCDI